MTLANAARRLNPPVRRRWAGPVAILLTDPRRRPDPRPLLRQLPAGTGVLLRPDPLGGAAQDRLAVAVARVCRGRRLVLLVSGDWRLAARLGAAGLHLPEAMARHAVLAPALAWRRRRRAWLTVAGHSAPALGRAARLGADAALLSPVFATLSHPGAAGLGAVRFGLAARRSPVALIALGGITETTARRLPKGAASGLAAIGGW